MHEKCGSQIQVVGMFFIETQSKVYRNHIDKILQINLLSDHEGPLYESDISRETHRKNTFTIKFLLYLTDRGRYAKGKREEEE